MVQNSLLDLSPLELRYLDQAVVEISTDPGIGEERPAKPRDSAVGVPRRSPFR
ncbi:hypothetical protein [Streptacidiphilus monticola]|uniref:FXSXX-COOH protein n=1 Tax=Streptacidiphilus monticola TaxID=2161674 RepID=A0ABW1G9J0_9ACTN